MSIQDFVHAYKILNGYQQHMKAPRTRIEDIRRVELIRAAHKVFMESGLGGLTTARICQEAGMSPGILAYYFKGKEEVLFAMVRYNNRALLGDIVLRLRAARSGWERLMAIVEGNFPAETYTSGAANAWLSVCAAAATNPQYALLQKIFYRRLASNIGSALGDAVAHPARGDIALAIGVMIDGLWLRKAADPAITRDEAVALIVRQTVALLGERQVLALRSPA